MTSVPQFTTKDVRGASYDDHNRFYHKEISSTLRMLGCEPEKIIPLGSLTTASTKPCETSRTEGSCSWCFAYNSGWQVQVDPLQRTVMELFLLVELTSLTRINSQKFREGSLILCVMFNATPCSPLWLFLWLRAMLGFRYVPNFELISIIMTFCLGPTLLRLYAHCQK